MAKKGGLGGTGVDSLLRGSKAQRARQAEQRAGEGGKDQRQSASPKEATIATSGKTLKDSAGQKPQAVTETAPSNATSGEVVELTSAANSTPSVSPPLAGESRNGETLRQLPVDQIRRGSYQPRQHFDKDALQELADSLKVQGMVQPVLVRPFAGGYEIVAGERRWRAAQLAGMHDIPAIVRDMDDQSVAAVSLIENIQRKDLNPMEEARALERLQSEFGMTHESVAESIGRSRAAVTNLLRLLDLHEEVKVMLDKGLLDMGHARALLGVATERQVELAQKVVKKGLSVRAVEQLVRAEKGPRKKKPGKSTAPVDPNIESLQRQLGDTLGASVQIQHQSDGGGRLEIRYNSLDELDGILEHIK